MAESSYFWNYDDITTAHEYPSQEFVAYFADFLSNGVYVKNGEMGLAVTMSGMTATVDDGTAFMRGYRYKNDGSPALTFVLSAAPSVAGIDRIDRIVLELDIASETMLAKLKKGTESSTPVPPVLENTSTLLELPLAQIRVKTNATTGTVTDERVPVSGLIEIPYTEMRAEFEQFMVGRGLVYDNWQTANQTTFDTWLDEIQEILDESTAGNLLSLIEANAYDIGVLQTDKMENSRIKLSTTDAVLAQMSDGDIWIKYE